MPSAVEKKEAWKGGQGVPAMMRPGWSLKALLGRWHLRRGLGILGERVFQAEGRANAKVLRPGEFKAQQGGHG